jgi:hypothetical protein
LSTFLNFCPLRADLCMPASDFLEVSRVAWPRLDPVRGEQRESSAEILCQAYPGSQVVLKVTRSAQMNVPGKRRIL